jgi:hypothetical protein
MGKIDTAETSVTNCQSTLRNIQEERRPLSDHVERLRANIELSFLFCPLLAEKGIEKFT